MVNTCLSKSCKYLFFLKWYHRLIWNVQSFSCPKCLSMILNLHSKKNFIRSINTKFSVKPHYLKKNLGSSSCGSAIMNPTSIHKGAVPSLALLSGLRIQCCRELQHRSQMWLGSCIAVAVTVASSCSSGWTPSLGTSICHRCSSKKRKEKKKKD